VLHTGGFTTVVVHASSVRHGVVCMQREKKRESQPLFSPLGTVIFSSMVGVSSLLLIGDLRPYVFDGWMGDSA
jgi:hypothetical protein